MAYERVVEQIFSEIENNKGALIHATSELVKIPSLGGKETEAQKFMASKYRETGLRVETFEANLDDIKKHPAYKVAFY